MDGGRYSSLNFLMNPEHDAVYEGPVPKTANALESINFSLLPKLTAMKSTGLVKMMIPMMTTTWVTLLSVRFVMMVDICSCMETSHIPFCRFASIALPARI